MFKENAEFFILKQAIHIVTTLFWRVYTYMRNVCKTVKQSKRIFSWLLWLQVNDVFIAFDISSIDHLISIFHRLHFYLDRFEWNGRALLGMICIRSVNCMCVLAGRMQLSCRICGNTSSWKKRRLSLGKQWLQAHQIFPDQIHNPIHIACAVSDSFQML